MDAASSYETCIGLHSYETVRCQSKKAAIFIVKALRHSYLTGKFLTSSTPTHLLERTSYHAVGLFEWSMDKMHLAVPTGRVSRRAEFRPRALQAELLTGCQQDRV